MIEMTEADLDLFIASLISDEIELASMSLAQSLFCCGLISSLNWLSRNEGGSLRSTISLYFGGSSKSFVSLKSMKIRKLENPEKPLKIEKSLSIAVRNTVKQIDSLNGLIR